MQHIHDVFQKNICDQEKLLLINECIRNVNAFNTIRFSDHALKLRYMPLLRAVIMSNRNINTLVINKSRIDSYGVHKIMEHLKCTSITSLDLSFNKNFGNGGAALIAEYLNGSSIKRLVLSHNNIEFDGVKCIAENLHSITHLALNGNKIYDKGIRCIAENLRCSSIIELELAGTGMTCTGACDLIANLSEETTCLNLSTNDFRMENCEELIKNLISSKITHLNLNYCGIGYALILLADNIGHTSLIHLDLKFNQIDDTVAISLANNLKNSSLVRLDLSGNNIDNEGFRALITNLNNSSITYLNLNHNDQSDDINDNILEENYNITCLTYNGYDNDNHCNVNVRQYLKRNERIKHEMRFRGTKVAAVENITN